MMKDQNNIKSIFILLAFILTCSYGSLTAQTLYVTGGVQCGNHGSLDCRNYQTLCPSESDAEILLSLLTDTSAQEIMWYVEDVTDQIIVAEGSNLEDETEYLINICAQKRPLLSIYHFGCW